MIFKMKILFFTFVYTLVNILSVQGRPNPFIGNVISSFSNLGSELGKKTADVISSAVDLGAGTIKNVANIGLTTGKLALTGFGGIGKYALDGARSVGTNALDMIGIVGNSMGSLGMPVRPVGDMAQGVMDKGIEAGKNLIYTGENIGTKAMSAADIVIGITSDTAINAANAGSYIAKGTLDAINYGVSSFFG